MEDKINKMLFNLNCYLAKIKLTKIKSTKMLFDFKGLGYHWPIIWIYSVSDKYVE